MSEGEESSHVQHGFELPPEGPWDFHFPRLRRWPVILVGIVIFLVANGAPDIAGHARDLLLGMGIPSPQWLDIPKGSIWPVPTRAAFYALSIGIFAWGVWPERKNRPHSAFGHFLRAAVCGVIAFLVSLLWLSHYGANAAPDIAQSPVATPPSGAKSKKQPDSPALPMNRRDDASNAPPKIEASKRPNSGDRSRFTDPLKEFIIEGANGKLRLSATPPESLGNDVGGLWSWSERVEMWVCENMGEYALSKVTDIDMRRGSAPTPVDAGVMMWGQIIGNLQALVDHDTWDPIGEPKLPKNGCRAVVGHASDEPFAANPPAATPSPPAPPSTAPEKPR